MRSQMRGAQWFLVVVAAGLAATGCGGDSGGGGGESQTPEADMTTRIIDDGGAGGSAGDAGSGGAADVGAGGATGGSADQGTGGTPAIRQVESCAQACQVYADCGRVDLWEGTTDNCLAACNPVEDDPRIGNFFGCVAVTSCANLDRCVVPEPPPPDCADVCAAQAACEGTFNLPAGLPNVGACENACGDATLGPLVTRCGASILGGVCDAGEFDRCLLDGLYGDCFESCQRLHDCGAAEAMDVVACTLACSDVQRDGDPLVRHRQEGRVACIVGAGGNCDQIPLCGQPATHTPVGQATVEELCAANAECPLLPAETCAEAAPELLAGLADGAIDCLVDQMTQHCADGALYTCFGPAPGAGGSCDERCLVANLCGMLPDGQSEGVCADECAATLSGGAPGDVAALQASFLCDGGETCADVQMCLNAGGPIDLCRVECSRLIECDATDGAQSCEDACVAGFSTVRGRAERACVGAVSDCGAVTRCVPPAPPLCQALCDLLSPCDLGGANCLTACDDADFADPEAFLPRLSCAASSDRCSARETCEGGDVSGGAACLAYCQATVSCNGGDEAALVQCVVDCGGGLRGADGLTFDGASACLVAAGPAAECGVLQACLNDVAPDAFCAGYCGALDHCGVAAGTVEECLTDCAGRLAEADFLDNAACTLNSVRRGSGCAAVAACNDIVVPPASPDCVDFCAAQVTCDDRIDGFLCERSCDAAPEGDAARAVCARRASCDELHLCVEAGDEGPAACGDACGAIAACPGAFGADRPLADEAACVADCEGTALLSDPAFPGELATCLVAAADPAGGACALPAIDACYATVNVDPACVDSWAALEVCGASGFFGGDQTQYYIDCMNNLVMDEAGTRTAAQCIVDTAESANGDMVACLFGVLQCFPGLVPM